MICPFCNHEMEEGALFAQKVPQWKSKNTKEKFMLETEKHMISNEIKGNYCSHCNKIIIDSAR